LLLFHYTREGCGWCGWAENKPTTSLMLLRWFHGKISGLQAVGKLKPAEDGLFLVRESVRHPGDFVLCVCCNQKVFHYRVIFQSNRLSIDNKEFFYNLIDMIEVRQRRCYLGLLVSVV